VTVFNRNLLTNKILLGSIGASIVLVFVGVYGPYVSDFLYFANLRLQDWLYVLGAAAAYLCAFEMLKLVKRLRRRSLAKPAT
jgi:Ca2+-transporting ATPase